jgi:hypothetical protein
MRSFALIQFPKKQLKFPSVSENISTLSNNPIADELS